MVHVYFAIRPEKLDITKSMIFGSMRRDFYLKHYDPDRGSSRLQQFIIEIPEKRRRLRDANRGPGAM